jgi:integrase
MKLTTAIARTLEPPSGKDDHFVWDDDLPSFGVRIRVGQSRRISRTWIYQYDFAGRTHRLTLGNVVAIGIEDARKTAGKYQGRVRNGDNPAAEKAEKLERAACTFANVLKNFLEEQKRTTRASTWKGTNSLLGEPCKLLYPMPLTAITRRDIANVLTPITALGLHASSNNVRSKLRAVFNWAIKKGLTETNPVLGTERRKPKPRERVLSMPELVAIWHTLNNIAFDKRTVLDVRDAVHLLMLTGARRAEICDLRWREIIEEESFIDDGRPIVGPAIVLPPERVKNNRKFILPLSKPAQAILLTRLRGADDAFALRHNSDIEHSSWSSYKDVIDAELKKRGHILAHWIIHDIRRSVATHMGHMGIEPHVIEEVLNHFRANVYNKSKLEGPKRRALEAWGKYLMKHVEGKASEADDPAAGDNVVQFQLQDLRRA